MSQNQTERVVGSLLGSLDDKLWDKLALKVIEKMPRGIVAGQMSNSLADFVVLNSKVSADTNHFFKDDSQAKGKVYEKYLGGVTEVIKKGNNRKKTVEIVVEKSKEGIHQKRVKRMSAKVLTEGAEVNKQYQNFLKDQFEPLFVQQVPNEQQMRNDEYFRASKFQKMKCSQKEQKEERERRIASEQRLLAQNRKFKDLKMFTFDYEGKVVSLAGKKSQNVKVLSIKQVV